MSDIGQLLQGKLSWGAFILKELSNAASLLSGAANDISVLEQTAVNGIEAIVANSNLTPLEKAAINDVITGLSQGLQVIITKQLPPPAAK